MANDLQRINATKYELESPFEVSKVIDPVTVDSITNPITIGAISSIDTITNPVTVKNITSDSFFRQRVGIPETLYEYNFQYNKAPLIWGERITGTASGTHLPNESSILLSTGGTASGARITRQTFSYLRYRPGKTLELEETFVFGAVQTNVIKRVGYFDDNDGVYFEQNGVDGKYYLVVRSSTSGSPVEIDRVARENWDDPLDGTGKSGYNLNLEKSNIFYCDLQWLGVGSVVFGFVVARQLYIVHEFEHAGLLDEVYMKTANLPVRYEIFNSGIATTTGTMKQICATVVSNGGVDKEAYYQHAVENPTERTISTTFIPLISIRPKLTFNSIVNRGQIVHEEISITNTGNATMRFQVIYNGSVTGGSWVSADDNSIVDYNITGTAISGGEITATGKVVSTAQLKNTVTTQLGTKYPVTLDIDGANPKSLTIAVRTLTGNTTAMGDITFREYY